MAAGGQRRWALTLETRIGQADAGGGGLAAAPMTLTGDWVVTVSGASATGYDVACELEHPHIAGGPAGTALLESRLSRRIWVTYQADGAATRIHFPREMDDQVRNLLEMVVTGTQVVRPAQHSVQWTATERDGAGAYLAVYREVGEGRILKKKAQYLSVDRAGDRASTLGVRLEDSSASVSLDAEGAVESLEGQETTRIDAPGMTGLLAAVGIRLDHARSGRADDLAGSLERARPGLVTETIVTQKPSEEEQQARRDFVATQGVTFADLLHAVRGGQVDGKTLSQLEAWLRQHPGDIAAAAALAREDGNASAVLRALGAAGTVEAQAALCAAARDGGLPATLRAEAIVALVRTTHPTPSTVSTLLGLLDDPGDPEIRKAALFLAGSIGGDIRRHAPDQTARIETALLGRYGRCAGRACIDTMIALGNLATPAVVPTIERALRDPDAALRAEAVRSLRLVQSPEADASIAATIAGDADAGVRAAAVFAATFRPLGPLVDALVRAVSSDPVEYVRSGAIDALAGHVDEYPSIPSALAAAAANDPKPGVRRLAQKVLESHGKS
jgi:HEAT repeat protein